MFVPADDPASAVVCLRSCVCRVLQCLLAAADLVMPIIAAVCGSQSAPAVTCAGTLQVGTACAIHVSFARSQARPAFAGLLFHQRHGSR